MKKTAIKVSLNDYPETFHPVMRNADIYDSSCSAQARVIFIDKDGGYFLKSSPRGTLEREAVMAEYFNKKGLTSNVLSYICGDRDWLLTEKVNGEDCTFYKYLDDPKRLCDTTATLLRELHELDYSDCPVKNRMSEYFFAVEENHRAGRGDLSLLSGEWAFSSTI